MLAAMIVGAIVTAAFGSNRSSITDIDVDWVGNGATAATPTAIPTATLQPTPASVTGFIYPVEGGCLPESDNLMPGAPREYRNGIHEGVDFYDADNCAFVGLDTEALAAKSGTVIRADWDYEDLTFETLDELMSRVERGDIGSDTDDAFRGRQAWIEHDDGTVTRYAHLSGIVEGIDVGTVVSQGQPIAYIGESGTPESVTAPGTEIHLHFEIRIGESYLGEGLDPEEIRALYEEAFAP